MYLVKSVSTNRSTGMTNHGSMQHFNQYVTPREQRRTESDENEEDGDNEGKDDDEAVFTHGR